MLETIVEPKLENPVYVDKHSIYIVGLYAWTMLGIGSCAYRIKALMVEC